MNMKKVIVPTLAVAVLGGGFTFASISAAHAQTTPSHKVSVQQASPTSEKAGSESSTGKDSGANVEQTGNYGKPDAANSNEASAEKAGSEASTGKDTGANVQQTGNYGKPDAANSNETSTEKDTSANAQ